MTSSQRDQGSSYSERERTIAEFAYEQGFWAGVQAVRDVGIALPEKWIDQDVSAALDYTEHVLATRGLTR